MMATRARAKRAAPSRTRQVQSYLASLPAASRQALRTIRAAVRSVAPGVKDGFSYGIPGYHLDGRPLVSYAAWKRHISVYPMGAAIRHAHARELEGYQTAKGTIQFPLDQPIPSALVKLLIRARIAELRARGK